MARRLITDMVRSIGLPVVKGAAGVVTRRLPIPQPVVLLGAGSSAQLGRAIADFRHHKLMVVTDAVIAQLGLMQPLLDALGAGGPQVVLFDAVTPDAPIAIVEQGIALYQEQGCDAILAFGGGSVIDAAKAIGLAAANDKHPRELVGYFKARRDPPPLYVVPTTAGTGSEVTVVSVISDPEQRRKLVIATPRAVPRMAALDPLVMTGLPPAITAATGMDALTHAVEAFIGRWTTEATDSLALTAVGLIFEYLPRAVADGQDLVARERMALASMYAGLAFTRADVGNVHAIAHQLGGLYHTPHGLANAIMLPHVLRFSLPEVVPRLAALAARAGIGQPGDTPLKQARQFVDAVAAMNQALGIPAQLDTLRAEDIPALAKAACWEADTNYPVPRVMSQTDCAALLRKVLPKATEKAAARTTAKTAAKAAAQAAGAAAPKAPARAARSARTRKAGGAAV